MYRRFLCFIGYHRWIWDWDGGCVFPNSPPPHHATCSYCGVKYKND